MRGASKRERTIFLHIPKTAGTSLGHALRDLYPGRRGLFVYSHDLAHDRRTLATLRRAVRSADVVFGHVSFGIHEHLDIDARYVTVVREPVARVWSFFRHQARTKDSDYFERIADGMTLTDLLRSGECHQLNNHMARVVSGHDPAEAVDDATLLEQALSNLEQHFAAVGVMEQMDRSMALMAERLQWAAPPSLPRLNVDPTPGTFHLDDDTRAEILRLNAVDAMVYECVVGSATVALSDVARAG